MVNVNEALVNRAMKAENEQLALANEALKAENKVLRQRIADLTVLLMRYQELLDNVVKLREELDKALPI